MAQPVNSKRRENFRSVETEKICSNILVHYVRRVGKHISCWFIVLLGQHQYLKAVSEQKFLPTRQRLKKWETFALFEKWNKLPSQALNVTSIPKSDFYSHTSKDNILVEKRWAKADKTMNGYTAKSRSYHNNFPPSWKSGKIVHCSLSAHTAQVKSSLYSQLTRRTGPQSIGKTHCGFDKAFLPNVFLSRWETVYRV